MLPVRRRALFASLLFLAAVLRIYAISLYPLTGDEYESIAGARNIHLNWNSIIYSLLTHFWIRMGDSEFWLRLPSAIFGIATVSIIFKAGEKLGGWRTGFVAGLLAATSAFNIYHSQEMRFYSLFVCASAGFMLATFHYVDARKTLRSRGLVLVAALALILSHFLGILALAAQATAAVLANKSSWPRRVQISAFMVLTLLMGLPLIPTVQRRLWDFYSIHAGVTDFSRPVINGVSAVNFAKVAVAGYTFVFGYHVYPLRLVPVIAGLSLTLLFLCLGCARLWQASPWRMLPLTYLLAVFAVFFVLNSIGGAVSTVIGPRHVGFVWPVFITIVAIGITSFQKPLFQVTLASLLVINGFSIWSGWQKAWTYGTPTDYRSAAAYVSQVLTKESAIVHDGRSSAPIDFYFPKNVPLIRAPLIDAEAHIQGRDAFALLGYQRLILVTDDWEPVRRRGLDQLLASLTERYSLVDGHVDYPLFEYVLDRKPGPGLRGYALSGEAMQVQQPLSFYGLEFQDLHLPVAVKVKDVTLNVIGAYGLPDLERRSELSIPLAASTITRRVVLLSNIVGAGGLQPGQTVGQISIESKDGQTLTMPLRLGQETASWDKRCAPNAACATVFQWHKRLAMVGQNSYEGAFRDFPAGLQGVVLDLPMGQEVRRLTVRYTGGAGRLYLWGIALPK